MDREKFPWIKDLPNQLTLFRIAIIPIYILLAPWDVVVLNYFAGALFAIAAITDWFDGLIARRFNAESQLGAILDPIADKLLVGAALVVLAARHETYSPIFALLVMRDIGVNGLRLLAFEKGFKVSVNTFGKLKTVIIDVAITCLTVASYKTETHPFGLPFQEVGFITLLLGTILSIYSAWLYWKKFAHTSTI